MINVLTDNSNCGDGDVGGGGIVAVAEVAAVAEEAELEKKAKMVVTRNKFCFWNLTVAGSTLGQEARQPARRCRRSMMSPLVGVAANTKSYM